MNTKKLSPARKFLRDVRGKDLTFGEMIHSLRECDGITQVQLAEKMNISRAYLCDIEKERRGVSPEMAARFAKVMGYSVHLFVAMALEDMLKRAKLKFKVHLEAA